MIKCHFETLIGAIYISIMTEYNLVEAVISMITPGSDEEKQYLEYLLKKHGRKKTTEKGTPLS